MTDELKRDIDEATIDEVPWGILYRMAEKIGELEAKVEKLQKEDTEC